MNIIFLTMNVFTDIEMHNIYSDLMKEFIEHGHKPYIITPREKKRGEATRLDDYGEYAILKVSIGNTSGVSFIEKGISTVLLQNQFMNAIEKHLQGIHFSLILYSTPPITLSKVIEALKRKHNTPTYLMLKDIFPQNAVDLQLFKENGVIHKYFRGKEKKLYQISDHIGCMSPANERYLLKHNNGIEESKVHLLPNGIIPYTFNLLPEKEKYIRDKYNIPYNKTVFMYGGNLGKPQNIPFVIECMKAMKEEKDAFFIICGTGSEYAYLEEYKKQDNPENFMLINGLPKKEYDELLWCCDVGLIFLDYRFTIPNFPSRMLSYMEYAIPVLACTDCNTDVGDIAEREGFGWQCESNDSKQFVNVCRKFINNQDNNKVMGQIGRKYLEEYYSSKIVYDIIQKRVQWEK